MVRTKFSVSEYRFFNILVKIKGIRRYLLKIKKVNMLLYPSDVFSINVMSLRMALKAFLISAAICIVCMLSGKMHMHGYVIMAVIIVILNGEILNKSFEKIQLKLLIQLENYLGEVRHYFHMNGILEDAIYDSMENCDYEISLHINRIYDILMSDDDDKCFAYKDMAPNKYFMTFMALCELVMQYGDTVKDDRSLFLENLNSLRDEIRNEIMKLQKTAYVFSGLMPMCLIPPLTLKLIENWGESNIPELCAYYDGKYGLVVSVLICLISISAYMLINRLKESYRYTDNSSGLLSFISDIPFVDELIGRYMFNKPVYVKSIHDSLKRAASKVSVKEYIIRKWLASIVTFVVLCVLYAYFIILPGTDGSYNTYLPVVVPMILLVSIAAGKVSDVALGLRMVFIKSSMEDEVLAFHSIIIMLMHISRMDVLTILEWMENFAQIFKASLMECVNSFSYNDEDALLQLENNEPYLPFVRIVGNLRSSDNVGIEKAFEEIYSQRKYFIEKRKQDNEISIANKGAIGRVVAFVPMIVTIGLYLIIPFVMQSMSQLMGYVNQMGNL